MRRPTGFADLAGRRVGVYGYGVEGRATAARLRGTCELVLVDDANLGPDVLITSQGGLDALLTCEVVLKTPGIARRRAEVLELERRGVTVTSALNLWLHDVERERVVAITGTKGKSTTTALVTFFLRCLGHDALALGNIGQPPYDPALDTSTGWLVLEVSSFQCVDLDVAPRVVVVTSLGADHLDWHGSLEHYRSDKLSLTRATGEHLTLVADSPTLRDVRDQLGGDLHYVRSDRSHLASALGLLGAHNDANVALALRVVEELTGVASDVIRHKVHALAGTFEPLRGRLTLVALEESAGVTRRYVDDGLATTVVATLAALEVFADEPVALIAGGFDRGVDYSTLADALAARRRATSLITMGPAGERLGDALSLVRPDLEQGSANSMIDAVEAARAALPRGGVVLMSPAAPSFDRYRNWEARSDDFTRAVRLLVATPEEPSGPTH